MPLRVGFRILWQPRVIRPPLLPSTTDPVTGNVTTVTIAPLGGGVNGSNGRKGIDIVGRNTFQMKRTIDMDLRLSKRVKFGEHYSVEALGGSFQHFQPSERHQRQQHWLLRWRHWRCPHALV